MTTLSLWWFIKEPSFKLKCLMHLNSIQEIILASDTQTIYFMQRVKLNGHRINTGER